MKTSEQIARDIREGTFPAKSEATLRENSALLRRPTGSNADEWQLFLREYLGESCQALNDFAYVAVQIAEAIDEYSKLEEVICPACCGDKVGQPIGEGCEACDAKGYVSVPASQVRRAA